MTLKLDPERKISDEVDIASHWKLRDAYFIFPLDGYSIYNRFGLDGEEIETVCELKGLSL